MQVKKASPGPVPAPRPKPKPRRVHTSDDLKLEDPQPERKSDELEKGAESGGH